MIEFRKSPWAEIASTTGAQLREAPSIDVRPSCRCKHPALRTNEKTTSREHEPESGHIHFQVVRSNDAWQHRDSAVMARVQSLRSYDRACAMEKAQDVKQAILPRFKTQLCGQVNKIAFIDGYGIRCKRIDYRGEYLQHGSNTARLAAHHGKTHDKGEAARNSPRRNGQTRSASSQANMFTFTRLSAPLDSLFLT